MQAKNDRRTDYTLKITGRAGSKNEWHENRNTSRLGGWYSQFIQDTEWKDGSQSSFRV